MGNSTGSKRRRAMSAAASGAHVGDRTCTLQSAEGRIYLQMRA